MVVCQLHASAAFPLGRLDGPPNRHRYCTLPGNEPRFPICRSLSLVAVVTELSQRLFASMLCLIMLHVSKQADPCDCSRTLPLKLTVSHLLKELPTFYGTRILKVFGSNRCQITDYYYRGVSWFSSVILPLHAS